MTYAKSGKFAKRAGILIPRDHENPIDATINAQLDWSLYAECPQCEEDINLADNDDDHVIAIAIFNNKWDRPKGHKVTCFKCKHESVIGEVEY